MKKLALLTLSLGLLTQTTCKDLPNVWEIAHKKYPNDQVVASIANRFSGELDGIIDHSKLMCIDIDGYVINDRYPYILVERPGCHIRLTFDYVGLLAVGSYSDNNDTEKLHTDLKLLKLLEPDPLLTHRCCDSITYVEVTTHDRVMCSISTRWIPVMKFLLPRIDLLEDWAGANIDSPKPGLRKKNDHHFITYRSYR